MSHVDTCSFEILNIEAAALAVRELGGTLVQQSTYKWWGRSVGDYPLPEGFTKEDLGKCEYAIKVPGCEWEIGLARRGNSYKMIFDWYGSEGTKLLAFIGGIKETDKSINPTKFKAKYTKHLQIQTAKKNGFLVRQQIVGTKTVLTFSKP